MLELLKAVLKLVIITGIGGAWLIGLVVLSSLPIPMLISTIAWTVIVLKLSIKVLTT